MSNDSVRPLLVGLIAFQMDLITRQQLIVATRAWLLQKSRPLTEILVEQGALREADRQLLLPLVERYIENHDGSATRSLAALSSLDSLTGDLRPLADEILAT